MNDKFVKHASAVVATTFVVHGFFRADEMHSHAEGPQWPMDQPNWATTTNTDTSSSR